MWQLMIKYLNNGGGRILSLQNIDIENAKRLAKLEQSV